PRRPAPAPRRRARDRRPRLGRRQLLGGVPAAVALDPAVAVVLEHAIPQCSDRRDARSTAGGSPPAPRRGPAGSPPSPPPPPGPSSPVVPAAVAPDSVGASSSPSCSPPSPATCSRPLPSMTGASSSPSCTLPSPPPGQHQLLAVEAERDGGGQSVVQRS